jgi:uncharacterized membrane protein YcaP (DUF421 family)
VDYIPDFLKLTIPFFELVIRCAVIYLVLLLGMRVFGKREIGQFTLFDLVFVLLVANAVQPAMTGPDTSLSGGLVIIIVLLLLNYSVSVLRLRVSWINRLVEPSPVLVGSKGRWNRRELVRQGITDAEADAALREHQLDSVSDVDEVWLEADGSLSVIPKEGKGDGRHRRPRRRFLRR